MAILAVDWTKARLQTTIKSMPEQSGQAKESDPILLFPVYPGLVSAKLEGISTSTAHKFGQARSAGSWFSIEEMQWVHSTRNRFRNTAMANRVFIIFLNRT